MESLLLIDRNRRTRRCLRALLSSVWDVTATHNIFRAFRLLRDREFDHIVVRTADRDAYALALLQWLHARWTPFPVVVLLGAHTDIDADRLRRLGAWDVMIWPGDSDRLMAAVYAASAPSILRRVGSFAPAVGTIETVSPRLAIAGRNEHRRRGAGRFRDEHERSWLRLGRLNLRQG